MLKTIPKSSVSRRRFPVYKQWSVSNSDYPIISASAESGFFDSSSFSSQQGVYIHPLYKSLRAKYYNQNANPFTLFGSVGNIARLDVDRRYSSTLNIISIPQSKYGEQIKPNSVILNDTDNDVLYADNGTGNLTSTVPLYTLVSIDFEDETIVIQDNDFEVFTGTITSFDVLSGIAVLTFGSDTDSVLVVKVDLENSFIQTADPLDFDGLDIDELQYGNVFYDEGLVVTVDTPVFSSYNLNFRSTQTIYETEVLITAKAGEFNYSQNPSAVEVTLSGSYDFNTTAVYNGMPAGTKKIKEVLDIKRKESFVGSVNSSISGSWDDYYNSSSIDPTGSYLSTYVTTIGLYDNAGDMVAVAKLPTPIKNLPDYDLNFIVRFDT
jgi:hypothetical protein